MASLLVYYSLSGNNRILAEHLASELKTDIEEVTEPKKRSIKTIIFDKIFRRKPRINPLQKDLSKYDLIVLVAPIWMGYPATPMISLLRNEASKIKQFAFATIRGGAISAGNSLQDAVSNLISLKPRALCDLQINDVLPEDDRGQMEKTSTYKLSVNDLNGSFKKQVQAFIKKLV